MKKKHLCILAGLALALILFTLTGREAQAAGTISTITVTTDLADNEPMINMNKVYPNVTVSPSAVKVNHGSCYWAKENSGGNLMANGKTYRLYADSVYTAGNYCYHFSFYMVTTSYTLAQNYTVVIDGVSYPMERESHYGSPTDYYFTVCSRNYVAKENPNVYYKVSFNTDGGSTVAAQSVKKGAKAVAPSVPSRGLDEFLGWYSDSALTKVYDFDTPVTGDRTLYAKWKVIPRTNVASVKITTDMKNMEPDIGKTVGDPEIVNKSVDGTFLNYGSCYWVKEDSSGSLTIDGKKYSVYKGTTFTEGYYRYHYSILLDGVRYKALENLVLTVDDDSCSLTSLSLGTGNYYYLSLFSRVYRVEKYSKNVSGKAGTVMDEVTYNVGVGSDMDWGFAALREGCRLPDGLQLEVDSKGDVHIKGTPRECGSFPIIVYVEEYNASGSLKEGEFSRTVSVGHKIASAYTVDKKASFTAAGSKSRKCTVCGEPCKTVSIPKAVASLSAKSFAYNGKVQTPTLSVTGPGEDEYSVSWSSGRKKVGTYTATVKLQGSYYTGTKKLSYTIKPAKVSGLELSNTSSGIKISWKAQTGVTGYQIYYKKSGASSYTKLTTVKDPAKTSYTTTKRTAGTTYLFKVRAYYKEDSGTVLYGSFCSAKSMRRLTRVSTPTITAVSGGLKLSWDSVKGVSGYEIQRKVSGTSSYTTVKKTTGTKTLSFTDKDLRSGTAYVYRIRAYYTSGSKTYYGAWSGTKKATAP